MLAWRPTPAGHHAEADAIRYLILRDGTGYVLRVNGVEARRAPWCADLVYAAQAHAGRRAATRGDCGMPYPNGWRPRRLARKP